MDPRKFDQHVRRLFVKPSDETGRLLHAAVGVAGEAGELLDGIKKHWIYGKALDRENLIEECGDLLFYVQAILNELGISMDDAMRQNMEKLARRYPEGYSDSAAIERADKKPSS